MRVVVVSAWEPWRVGDGAVLPLHRHLHELAARHEITVLAAGSHSSNECAVDAPATTLPEGVRVRWFGTSAPRTVDYAMRRLRAVAQREPAHVFYVERPALLRALRAEATSADLVYLAGWGTARLAAVVGPTPAVHFAVDPWAASWHNRRLPGWRRVSDLGERGLVQRHERRWYPAAKAVVVVSEADAVVLRRELPDVNVVTVTNGVDPGPEPVSPPRQPTIGFHGAFETQANVDGARALVRDVLPLVRRDVPDVRAVLIGRDPSAEVLALEGPAVQVRGSVPDMRAELDRISVHVTWMPSGLGMKNKVLEAMAAGRPVVANDRGASGIGGGGGLEVAPDVSDAARWIVELLRDPALLARTGAAARERVLHEFTWTASAATLERAWQQAVS